MRDKYENNGKWKVTAERIDAGRIEGTSKSGSWHALLPLNGKTMYWYPSIRDENGKHAWCSDAEKAAIRKAVRVLTC